MLAFYNFSISQIFSKYLVFCAIGIANAELYERAQLEIRRNQVMHLFEVILCCCSVEYLLSLIGCSCSYLSFVSGFTRSS